MKDYSGSCPTGNPLKNPNSDYFNSRQRRYAFTIQGVFKKDIQGNDLLWHLDLTGPLRTPPGTGIALRIAKWLEPSLDYDLNHSIPWMNAPALTTMNSFGVYSDEEFKSTFLLDNVIIYKIKIKN